MADLLEKEFSEILKNTDLYDDTLELKTKKKNAFSYVCDFLWDMLETIDKNHIKSLGMSEHEYYTHKYKLYIDNKNLFETSECNYGPVIRFLEYHDKNCDCYWFEESLRYFASLFLTN